MLWHCLNSGCDFFPTVSEAKSYPQMKSTIAILLEIFLHFTQTHWDFERLLNRYKKIICIDGKTMRSNKRNEEKPSHIVSAWCKEDGFCLGQKAVDEKSNEITAIPDLLDKLQIKK